MELSYFLRIIAWLLLSLFSMIANINIKHASIMKWLTHGLFVVSLAVAFGLLIKDLLLLL